MSSRPVVRLALVGLLFAGAAGAQGWPQIFDPLVLRTIQLQMNPGDWQTIQNDETLSIWVPTTMWLDGETPILVAIRRKSADPLDNAPNYRKVSYKIDVNEYVTGQNWHGLRAVSLDNGDDEDVVSEGLAWYLHRLASGPEGYGYDAGLASWVRLVINGVDTGVYVHTEQRDKRFLQNRGLWTAGQTWLYDVEDATGLRLDEGGPGDSPLVQALCHSPFGSPSTCPTPTAATLTTALPPVIDMQGLLALAAVDTFCANPDGIFSHAKNFYFADFVTGQRRHFPWDLDSALPGGGLNHNVYAPQSSYSQVLLGVPAFRAQFSLILNNLVCGPFRAANLHGFLDALEPVLAGPLAADPNNQLGGQSVTAFFAARKAWLSQRLQVVSSQIQGFVACAPSQASALPYGTGCAGLGLVANGVPHLGNSVFALSVTGVPTISPIGLVAVGTAMVNPGIDLTAIGMPGCSSYTPVDIGLFAGQPAVAGFSTFGMAIPTTPSLVGAVLVAQGASLSLATPLGLITSNGVRVLLGT